MGHVADMFERLLVLLYGARRATVRDDSDFIIAHCRVMRRAQDAAVCGQTSQHKGGDIEVPQQHVERCLIETRMHRLENTVIFRVRLDRPDKVPGRAFRPQTIRKKLSGIRLPLAEIVVHINHGHTSSSRSLFQSREGCDHRHRIPEEAVTIRKFKMIDHVHQQYRYV